MTKVTKVNKVPTSEAIEMSEMFSSVYADALKPLRIGLSYVTEIRFYVWDKIVILGAKFIDRNGRSAAWNKVLPYTLTMTKDGNVSVLERWLTVHLPLMTNIEYLNHPSRLFQKSLRIPSVAQGRRKEKKEKKVKKHKKNKDQKYN